MNDKILQNKYHLLQISRKITSAGEYVVPAITAAKEKESGLTPGSFIMFKYICVCYQLYMGKFAQSSCTSFEILSLELSKSTTVS